MWFFPAYVLVGLLAQFIDGALGMAYGVICSTFLLTLGIAPAFASASVKTAEVFTTAVSGIAHFKLGNVDHQIMVRLAVPGVLGGVSGAALLSHFSDSSFIIVLVAGYLLIMGAFLIHKALQPATNGPEKKHRLIPLGLVGGFLDSIGGGGWGSIVASTLIAGGKEARMAIGSVNMAEFFVNISQVITFGLMLDFQTAQLSRSLLVIIGGLIVGGIIAAPLAAYACKKIPTKKLMFGVGIIIIVLSLRNLATAL